MWIRIARIRFRNHRAHTTVLCTLTTGAVTEIYLQPRFYIYI